ncbi:MAG: hypothetical protein ACFE0S_09925 [Rhodospirillales bacterium]
MLDSSQPAMARCKDGALRTTYRTLALVTAPAQLAQLDADADTLVVTCDWLMLQSAEAGGFDMVFYELGIADWSEPDNLDSDLMVFSNRWVYADGEDISRFRGVSLGKLFHSEVLFCHINAIRLERALRKLIERFRPENIQFLDFANDINVLTKDIRLFLVRSVAEEMGVGFLDRSNANSEETHKIAEDLMAYPPKPGIFRRIASVLYGRGLDTLTALRCAPIGKPRVLLLLGGNTIEPLLAQFSSAAFTPVVNARTVPKRFGALLDCVMKGVRLFDSGPATLDKEDAAALDKIRQRLKSVLHERESIIDKVLYRFLETHLLEGRKMEWLACEVRKAERLMTRLKPARIVVDGVRNPPPRTFVEMARAHGAAVDYIWHSPMVPQYLKFDAVGGDPNMKPMVDRCFSWGPMNDHWLDAVGAEMPRVTVGSPIGDRYRSADRSSKKRVKPVSEMNVLILQYTPILSDMKGLNANVYTCFVELVRQLTAAGFGGVRYKLHPGPGRWKKEYFQDIAGHFGIECEILKREPFSECLDWADVVVGPAQSGAFFETLAAGKPYYPIIIAPNSFDTTVYKNYPIYASTDDVVAAAVKGELEVAGTDQGFELLDRLYSIDAFPSGSARFWQVLNDSFTEGRP